MKTIKVSETTHKQIIELQSYIYKNEGIKLSINELISYAAAILEVQKSKNYGSK